MAVDVDGRKLKIETTGGNADSYEKKGVEEKAIRKRMKAKGQICHLCFQMWIVIVGGEG